MGSHGGISTKPRFWSIVCTENGDEPYLMKLYSSRLPATCMATGTFSRRANSDTFENMDGWQAYIAAGATPMVMRSPSTSSRQCMMSFSAMRMA